ncbi:hypothetical protein [Nonomuraea sp. NPDC050691]|uniref:hypothetical protein n=1 Tax=Nonomuraea sp. NPDC050691 TaxID=3155661 RepID=UPI0033FDA014
MRSTEGFRLGEGAGGVRVAHRLRLGEGAGGVRGVSCLGWVVVLVASVALAGCGEVARPYTPGNGPGASTPAIRASDASPPTTSGNPGVPSTEGADEPSASRPAIPRGTQTVGIGDSMRVRIEWPSDADPLVRLVADYYVASRRAVVTGDDGYLDNLEYDAVGIARGWVDEFADQERSLRGVARLYNLRVQSVMGKGAQVNACVDETGVRLVSTRTGKAVSRQPAWTRAPYMQGVAAHRYDGGVWRIRTFVSGEEGCGR